MTIFLCVIAGVLLTALALMFCACAMYIADNTITMCIIWYIASAVILFWTVVSYAEYLNRELWIHPTLFGRRVSFCTFKLVVFAEAVIWPVWLLANAVYCVYLTCIEEEK